MTGRPRRVDVIIPTLDRPDHVEAVLRDLVHQAPPAVEVLIVDQSEPAVARRLARAVEALEDDRFTHLRSEVRGLPAARNLGIASTTAPILLFLDDDVRLLPGLIEAHQQRYDDPRVGGVVGRIVERVVRPNARRTANRIGPGGRVITNLSGHEARPVEALKGANMSLRRQALAQVGGFDRHYRGTALLEDADIAARIRAVGWTVWFEPAAELVHLSAGHGGVRQADALRTERWRFHNTAYYVRRHRGNRGWPALVATFTAIALRRAAAWRRPGAVRTLLRALREGWALAAEPPDTELPEGG